jgi:hypothetical protein
MQLLFACTDNPCAISIPAAWTACCASAFIPSAA